MFSRITDQIVINPATVEMVSELQLLGERHMGKTVVRVFFLSGKTMDFKDRTLNEVLRAINGGGMLEERD